MYFKFFTIGILILSPLGVLAIQDNNQDSPKDKAKETIQIEFQEALKKYEDKKQLFQTEVLNLFDRKETMTREKGDLKSLNVIKKEKDAFLNTGKEPSLFFITDQKRFMELAKADLIKAYEKAVKDCIKAKLDFDAEEFAKELEEFKAGKVKLEYYLPNSLKEKITKSKDLFQAGSFWADVQPGGMVLEVVSRNTNSFSALYYSPNKSKFLDVSGTIEGNKINWKAKDVKILKGKLESGNNIGTISKDSIEHIWFTHQNKKGGEIHFKLIHPSSVFDTLIGNYKLKSKSEKNWEFLKILKDENKGTPKVQMKNEFTKWSQFSDWGVTGNTLLLYSNNIDLFTLEKITPSQLKYSVYWAECKGGFRKTYLPNRQPDKVFFYDVTKEK